MAQSNLNQFALMYMENRLLNEISNDFFIDTSSYIFANRAETFVGTLKKYMQRLIANAFVYPYSSVDLFVTPVNSLFRVNRPNFAM